MIPNHNPFWPRHSFRFLGGGGGGAQAIQSAPVPTPAPPVTPDAPAVIAAEQEQAQANLLKKSVKKTILAGDVGYNPLGNNVAGQPGSNTSGYRSKLG